MTESNFESLFDSFLHASTVKSICTRFQALTSHLSLDLEKLFALSNKRLIFKEIKAHTLASSYWRANKLWEKYEKRLEHVDYEQNNEQDFHVVIIGCGPIGLRLSIECALMGFKCTIIEKRDKFSRNNVLHLWPYTIVDLERIGAKQFYPKFGTGQIDHISIKKLQCILLKAALLLGVHVHFNVTFESICDPNPNDHKGWKIQTSSVELTNSLINVNSVIGADGRRNTLPGFRRLEMRGRLALGITANFVNMKTPLEAQLDEKGGVASIFAQKFFRDLYKETQIDLENIVYYKDDTHYFVMTAKKESLIERGVIKQNFGETNRLLARDNINFDALCEYARDAAHAAINKKLDKSQLIFTKNDSGSNDVSMFDFTSLYQAVNSSRIVEKHGHKLFLSLVGDSLVEPFWPTGTGIARGFMAAFDTAWSLKHLCQGKRHPLEILCERETIYKLLTQTTHDNLSKSHRDYGLDPKTRYTTSLIGQSSKTNDFKHLYETDGLIKVVPNDKPKEDEKPIKMEIKKTPPKIAPKPININLSSKNDTNIKPKPLNVAYQGQDICHICGKCVYIMEKKTLLKYVIHRSCFKCEYCDRTLSDNYYKYNIDATSNTCHFYCNNHLGKVSPKKRVNDPSTFENSDDETLKAKLRDALKRISVNENENDANDDGDTDMNLLRSKFKSILINTLGEENGQEEEEEEQSPSPQLNEKLSVFFAATQLFGTLCKEAPNERAVYSFNHENQANNYNSEKEEEIEEELKGDDEEEKDEKEIKVSERWTELMNAFETQRKRDELEIKLNELERDGVELQKTIEQETSECDVNQAGPGLKNSIQTRLKHMLTLMRLKKKMHQALDKLNQTINSFQTNDDENDNEMENDFRQREFRF